MQRRPRHRGRRLTSVGVAVCALVTSGATRASAQGAVSADSLERLRLSHRLFDLQRVLAAQADGAGEPSVVDCYRGVALASQRRDGEAASRLQACLDAAPPDSLRRAAQSLLGEVSARRGRFDEASQAFNQLIDAYATDSDTTGLGSWRNAVRLWSAFRREQPQAVMAHRDTTVRTSRDLARLLNVPVTINGRRMESTFDSGANLSLMVKSVADQVHPRFLADSLRIGSATGVPLYGSVAIVDSLVIGATRLTSVPFLVVDDASMTFGGGAYRITSVIGLPVMSALGTVTLHRDGRMDIGRAPAAPVPGESNLAADGLGILIEVTVDGQRLPFSFDTGSRTSMFYPPFATARGMATDRSAATEQLRLGGAGATRAFPATRLRSVAVAVGRTEVLLTNVAVLLEPPTEKSKYLAGVIGMDVTEQFELIEFDWPVMQLRFGPRVVR